MKGRTKRKKVTIWSRICESSYHASSLQGQREHRCTLNDYFEIPSYSLSCCHTAESLLNSQCMKYVDPRPYHGTKEDRIVLKQAVVMILFSTSHYQKKLKIVFSLGTLTFTYFSQISYEQHKYMTSIMCNISLCALTFR